MSPWGGPLPFCLAFPSHVPMSMLCLPVPTTGGGSTPGFLFLMGGGAGLAGWLAMLAHDIFFGCAGAEATGPALTLDDSMAIFTA